MAYLDDFIHWVNNEVGGEGPLPGLEHGDFGQIMGDSLARHYAEDRQKGGLRMSNIGKPAVVLALAHLGYVEPEPKGKSRFIFLTGDMYENWLEVMLKVYGFEIIDSQPEMNFLGITGHADFVIKNPATNEPLILEAKTMSEGYARMFSRELNDDRGYISQLAMYSHGYRKEPTDCTWICFNKGNSETFEIVPPEGLLLQRLDRAEQVIKRVRQVKSLDDILELVRVPPPRAEVYKKQETGKYLVPGSLSYSPFKRALYVTSDGKNGYGKDTTYVDRIADTEHMKRELDFLVANGVVLKND
jgi:hypothetical protein